MKTLYHCTPLCNMQSIMEKGLIPMVGQRSDLIDDDKCIYLFPTYEDCQTALYQWLGEEFDESDTGEVVTLKITLPDNFQLERTCEWEMISRNAINPKYISFYKSEG